MAVLVRDPSGADYGFVEQELQDRILTIYGTKDNETQLFRPDLADHHKVGFFGLDRTSQTDVTEIVDLKEMTEVLQILLQDVATLKRDINFAKHVMQADYESRLQQKSLELYCRINQRVTDLEKMHEERVGTVRRAFRQQLSDAIARVAVLYNKNLQRKVNKEKSKLEGDADKHEEKFKEMQSTIQRNESIIHMLKMQIQQLQKEPSIADSPSVGSERPSAVTPQTPSFKFESPPTTAVTDVRPPVEESLMSKSPSINHEAEELREELEAVNNTVESLKDNLQAKEDEKHELNKDINKLNDQLTKEQLEKEQLLAEIESLKSSQEQDKDKASRMIERQKQEMEKLMEERLKQAKMASSAAVEEQLKAKQQAEKDKIASLHEQERKLKEELAREFEEQMEEERAKVAESLQGDTDVNRMRKTEQMLRDEVNRLKRETEKIHKTWEKKFAILQQSLHALKDESYIRQTLQRQAAALHHAAVSYSVDTPMGIHPTSKHTSPTKRPLPDIPKYTKGMMSSGQTPAGGHEKDYISYTVSAPSGRGTAIFSADENQIMNENDKEDIPQDVVPLPEKPQRSSTSGNRAAMEDGQKSKERGRVIIVPHVPVS